MGKWKIVVMVAGLLWTDAGCVSQIKRVDPNWDGSSPPSCTSDTGLMAGDILIGLGVAGGSLLIANAISGPNDTNDDHRGEAATVAIGGLVVGTLFEIAAAAGFEEIKDCRIAKAQYRIGTTIGTRAGQVQAEAHIAAPTEPAGPPRGVFCTSSPTVPAASFCARERDDCDRAKDAAGAGVGDMSECALTEVAWCFAKRRCAATKESCETQTAAASGPACWEER